MFLALLQLLQGPGPVLIFSTSSYLTTFFSSTVANQSLLSSKAYTKRVKKNCHLLSWCNFTDSNVVLQDLIKLTTFQTTVNKTETVVKKVLTRIY